MTVVKSLFSPGTIILVTAFGRSPAFVDYTGFVIRYLIRVAEVFRKSLFAVHAFGVWRRTVDCTAVVQIVLHNDCMQTGFVMNIRNFGPNILPDFGRGNLPAFQPDYYCGATQNETQICVRSAMYGSYRCEREANLSSETQLPV